MTDTGAQTREESRKPWSALIVVHLLCLLIFTGLACYVLYEMGQAAKAMGEATTKLANRADGIGAKVEHVAGSAASVGRSVETLAASVEKLARKAESAHQLAKVLKLSEGSLSPEEEKLIDELLRAVRGSGLKFARGGKQYSALTAYAWLWAKFKILKTTISSADDFVAKIGTKELVGDPYEVVMADGTKKVLAEWLTERLAELRKKPKTPKTQ